MPAPGSKIFIRLLLHDTAFHFIIRFQQFFIRKADASASFSFIIQRNFSQRPSHRHSGLYQQGQPCDQIRIVQKHLSVSFPPHLFFIFLFLNRNTACPCHTKGRNYISRGIPGPAPDNPFSFQRLRQIVFLILLPLVIVIVYCLLKLLVQPRSLCLRFLLIILCFFTSLLRYPNIDRRLFSSHPGLHFLLITALSCCIFFKIHTLLPLTILILHIGQICSQTISCCQKQQQQLPLPPGQYLLLRHPAAKNQNCQRSHCCKNKHMNPHSHTSISTILHPIQ